MTTNVKALIDAIKTADPAGGGRCECDDGVDQFYGQGKRRHHRCHWEMSSLFNIHLVYVMAPAIQKANSLSVGENE